MTAVVLPLVAAQLLAALGLAGALHRPTRWWGALPAAAAALGADLLFTRVTGERLRPLAGALSLGLVAVLLGQLVRPHRAEVVRSAASGASVLLVVVPPAAVIGLHSLGVGYRPTVAIVAAAVLGAVPLPRPGATGVLRVAVATAAAALICSHSSLVEPFDGILLGLAAGAAAVVAERGLLPSYLNLLAPVLVGITAGAIVGRGIFA